MPAGRWVRRRGRGLGWRPATHGGKSASARTLPLTARVGVFRSTSGVACTAMGNSTVSDHADQTRADESLRPISGFAVSRRAPNVRHPRPRPRRLGARLRTTTDHYKWASLIRLAQSLASDQEDFFLIKGPGVGDRATAAFMSKLRQMAAEEPVHRLVLVSKPGALKRLAQPGAQAVTAWARAKHGPEVIVLELEPTAISQQRRPVSWRVDVRSTATHREAGNGPQRFIAARLVCVIHVGRIARAGACHARCRRLRPYAPRGRQGTSGGRFPAVRSRTPAATQDAAVTVVANT